MIMIRMLSDWKGFFSAPVMNWYFPRMRRKKEPLMPGRIMAQIAIIPERKMNHHVSGVVTGIIPTKK